MDTIFSKIEETGIIPVVVLDRVEDAAPLAKALCDGGLPCAEVTFRTEAAEESIRVMTEQFPQMLVGAGTVLTTEQVNRALDAGAKFIVSPGLNPAVVDYCVKRGIPILPGCSTPSDVEMAMEFGLHVVKFFPAEPAGGLNYIKAISAPYSSVRFMPTGGINPRNVSSYLKCPAILACGGSWMVKKDLVREGKYDEIEKLVHEAVDLVKEARKENAGL